MMSRFSTFLFVETFKVVNREKRWMQKREGMERLYVTISEFLTMNFQAITHELCLKAHGPRPIAHGLWLMARGEEKGRELTACAMNH